ncbi:MAG: N-acetylornithine carbamoyltransferase [Gammaproteobacteria bacterium]
MRHLTRFADLGADGARRLIERAEAFKGGQLPDALRGRILILLFLAPSLRTRVSFQVAMARAGGSAIVLEAGGGIWPLETREGIVMDQDRVEHIEEALGTLSRYGDALAVRVFAELESDEMDLADRFLNQIREKSGIPVISMESAAEHPCQGLADAMTILEHHPDPRALPVLLRWVPHVKPLPKAVPNSFLLTAAAFGCQITVSAPHGFELPASLVGAARMLAVAKGGTVTESADPDCGSDGSKVLYLKSWGPAGHPRATPVAGCHAHWRIGSDWLGQMPEDALLLHCLPLRRNVEIEESALQNARCRIFDQAENRIYVQQAALEWLFGAQA